MGDSILQVAEALFLEDGFRAVTMEAVAARAGISKGTLYARYPGKAQLFLAIAAEYRKRPRSRRPLPAPADHSSLCSWAAEVASQLIETMTRPNVIAYEEMVRAAGRRFPKLVREMHEMHYEDNAGVIRQDLVEAARHFGVPLPDPDFAVDLLFATIWGWARLDPQQGRPDRISDLEAARRAGALFARGLGLPVPAPED